MKLQNFLNIWTFEPSLTSLLLVYLILYLVGLYRLWHNAGVNQGIRIWQVLSGISGLLALAVALLSPIDILSSLLFSMHMVQHLLLMIIAAPLIILSSPLIVILWALPIPARKTLARGWRHATILRRLIHTLLHPMVTWLLFTLTIWLWHLPNLFNATLNAPLLHDLEHISFLGASLLFWQTLFQPLGRRRLGQGAAVLYLFTASLQGGALGALFTFSSSPWYDNYIKMANALGLSALADQQVAGLIMWLPLGTVFTLLAGAFLMLWIREVEQRLNRSEHYWGK